MKSERGNVVAVAAVAAGWGMIGVIVRQVDLPAVAIVFSRCLLASLALAAAGGWRQHRRGEPLMAPLRSLPSPALLVGLGALLAVHWLCLVGAQQRAPLGTVLLLTYLAPVIVAVLAPRVLGEHVPRVTVVALAVALAGTVLLAKPGKGEGLGIALAVAAGVTYAAMTLLSKLVVGRVGGARLGFVQLSVATTVLALPAALADWGQPRWEWLWLVVLGVFFTGVLGPLYLVLLSRLPASTVGVLTYVEPVSAVVLAWLLLDETPAGRTVAGGMLVVLAGIMVIRSASVAAPGRGSVDRVPG
ncbi:MAG TPA: DMT family transporter [Acidimicrobiales bacterium]